jgi:CHASE2 domain-containing sensor protein
MTKLVLINLGSGNLQAGCSEITARVFLVGKETSSSGSSASRYLLQSGGSLPPAPELAQLYQHWQLLYREYCRELESGSTRALEIEADGVTHFSEVEFRDFAWQLKCQLNTWLNCESFHAINLQLSQVLNPNEEIRLVLETSDELLRRLPWPLWNFFENYPQAELALSTSEYRQVSGIPQISPGLVRILAIFGNSDDLDLQAERSLLEALPNTTLLILESPSHRELNEHLWDSQGWDILFFAGHSQTEGESGRIKINAHESLTLEQLRYALQTTIRRGLKLAIFNSCDGLGLGRDLADLHIPQVIVMREPVADQVASTFFQDFLAAFASGHSLYVAVREARERLERLEGTYPYATWLPVLCQNPTEDPITWQDLVGLPPSPPKPKRSFVKYLFTLFSASLVLTVLIMGFRFLGLLQPFELNAFDHLMQWRPQESQDERLLLVTIDEADIQYQNEQNMPLRWSLSDTALSQLLEKLEPLQPRTIGLDIYRDFATASEEEELKTRLEQDDRFFAVCKVSTNKDGSDGTPPPPEVPPKRLGFSDFVADSGEIARRHLLHLTPPLTSPCAAEYAFSLQLALHYLDAEGIEAVVTPKGELTIGDVPFERLQAHASGYQGIDAAGYQILLNYRALEFPEAIAKQVSLQDLLNEQINPELLESLKNRLVLIGVTAQSTTDYWQTPSRPWLPPEHKLTPGVFVQAQMVSQILSAVLDQRPLLWWWPLWAEFFWVWLWSLIGGLIAWRFSQPLHLGSLGLMALLVLLGICTAYLIRGGWIPLVPSALALILTQVVISVRIHAHSD